MTVQRVTGKEHPPAPESTTGVTPNTAESSEPRPAEPKGGAAARPSDSKLDPSEVQENLRKAEGDEDLA